MNLGHASRELRVDEGLQWPAHWGRGPGEAIDRGRLEQGLLRAAESRRWMRQSPLEVVKDVVRYVYALT